MNGFRIAGLVVALALGATGTLAAQERLNTGRARPPSAAVPPSARPAPEETPPASSLQDMKGLFPDLQVALDPHAMDAVPTQFTVKNAGSGKATKATLLKVTVRLMPLVSSSPSGVSQLIQSLTAQQGGDLLKRCPQPLNDFQAVIQPLEGGQSQVVQKPASSLGGALGGAAQAAVTSQNSYIKQVQVKLVCVYEVKAVADANGDLAELNEQNNQITHYFQREVTLQ